MYETATCRYCHKTIKQGRVSGVEHWMPVQSHLDVDRYCREAPASVLYHSPSTGTDADPRPEGPYMLHLGVHLFEPENIDDDPEQIPADTLGPDFQTDGDSWNQWGEPFDGTQRVTVALDAIPADPDEHALEAARALQALLGIRGVRGRVGDYASYTVGDHGDRSEWEIVTATCDA